MKLAGCNLMSVGIFAWSALEPEEGKYDFDWLEDVLDRLHAAGISAFLATPSGARPAWMSQKYPEVLRVRRGRRAQPARRAPQPLLHLPRLPGLREPDERRPGPALRPSPGGGGLAHLQRIQRRVPLRAVPGRLPRFPEGALRHAGRPERRLVDRLLEQDLHRLGASCTARPPWARTRCTG